MQPVKNDPQMSSPPPTNRGVENTNTQNTENLPENISIHWLRGTIDADAPAVSAAITADTGAEVSKTQEYGRYFYRRQTIFDNGIILYHDPSQENMPQSLIDISGQACERLNFHQMRSLFRHMKLTRVDIAVDGCPFTPRQLRDAAERGDIRSRSRNMAFYEKINQDIGNTFYLGSRNSPRMLRVYDMRETGTRLEVEMKEDAAEAFKGILMNDIEDIPQQFLGTLRDMVDFVDAQSDSNKSRATLLDWWAAFTEYVPQLKVRIQKIRERTIDSIRAWIESQCAKSMYILKSCDVDLGLIMATASLRLSKSQQQIIDDYRMSLL